MQHKSKRGDIRRKLLQLVARTAATQLASLSAPRRADLLEGLALVLPGKKDKDLARYTAGLIRLADEHQVKFFEQLNEHSNEGHFK